MGSRKYSTPVDIWSIGCIFAGACGVGDGVVGCRWGVFGGHFSLFRLLNVDSFTSSVWAFAVLFLFSPRHFIPVSVLSCISPFLLPAFVAPSCRSAPAATAQRWRPVSRCCRARPRPISWSRSSRCSALPMWPSGRVSPRCQSTRCVGIYMRVCVHVCAIVNSFFSLDRHIRHYFIAISFV